MFLLQISGSLHVVLDQTESSSSMKNLSDFQINSTTKGSMSEGISVDMDEQSRSNSQPSLEDEGIDELSALSNWKNEQITVKVCYLFYILNRNSFYLLIVCNQRSPRFT
jgi:hypothetical protein